MKRLLLYQPNHGLAVEAHLLQVAMRIAHAAERTLVVPLIPVLETHIYEKGLDAYFQLPTERWISHEEFLVSTDGHIDVLIHIVPSYMEEYNDELVRELHPVWLENIDAPQYFERAGCTVREVKTCDVPHVLNDHDICQLIGVDSEVVALSHINKLLTDIEGKLVEGDHFAGNRFAPIGVSEEFDMPARKYGEGDYDACHFRDSVVLRTVCHTRRRERLPSLKKLLAPLSNSPRPLYIATDSASLPRDPVPRAKLPVVDTCSYNGDVAGDIAACVHSNIFVGCEASTLSHLIVHLRRLAGHTLDKTHLILNTALRR